jgi:hypothetical protein
MLSDIALALSELPTELITRHCLTRRIHDRGGEREVRFLFAVAERLLPVWRNGQLQVLRWGNRRGESPRLPCTDWTQIGTTNAERRLERSALGRICRGRDRVSPAIAGTFSRPTRENSNSQLGAPWCGEGRFGPRDSPSLYEPTRAAPLAPPGRTAGLRGYTGRGSSRLGTDTPRTENHGAAMPRGVGPVPAD